MKQVNQTNKALLRVLGLADIEHITAVDIAMRPGELPQVTVQMLCPAVDPKEYSEVFRLIAPIKPRTQPRPAFDLDAMCDRAQERLRNEIDYACADAITQLAFDQYDRAYQYTGFVRELLETRNPYPF